MRDVTAQEKKPKGKSYRHRLRSLVFLQDYISKYYKLLNNAQKEKRLVAAVSLGFPIEFLLAFDIIPMYPQNYGSMCASIGKSKKIIEEIEGEGYSIDLCSQVKLSIGAVLYQRQPFLKLPRPDIILCGTNVCRAMVEFSQKVSKTLGIPFFLLDAPFVTDLTPPRHYHDYVLHQYKDLITFLEKVTGKKLDYRKFHQVIHRCSQTVKLWREILHLAAHRPSPIDILDAYAHTFPLVSLRGDPQAVRYYDILLHEVRDRVQKGIGAVRQEKYRLLWDYLPIFHKMNFFSRTLSKLGACVVGSTFFTPLLEEKCGCSKRYFGSFLFPKFLFGRALRAMSEDIMKIYPNTSLRLKVENIRRHCQRLSIDGVIIHCDRGCKPQSLPQYHIRNIIEEELGIPCLIVDANSADPRLFSEGQIVTRIEAFLECLAANKAKRS